MSSSSNNNDIQLIKNDKLENIKKVTSRLQLFVANGDVLFAEPPVRNNHKDDVNELIVLFETSNKAIAQGINVDDSNYELHRCFEDMVVGRKGEESTGEGVAFIKCPTKSGSYIFMLVTYPLPTLSAKIVPMMKEYCAAYNM
ncbi:hypothetical protein SAMD00019534_078800, partial [Acytostelium subglobosum LB1]|uniref:hypothetical protein n=1 Tax=Acytostelium subglobosum LB1 TaxID=1410327 RepID=UPI000645019A